MLEQNKQRITKIFRIKFNLIPLDGNNGYGYIPYDYLFRGLIMNWVGKNNHGLGLQLHQTDKPVIDKVTRKYSMWHEKFTLKNIESINTETSRNNGYYYHFYLNIVNDELVETITQHLIEKNSAKIILGHQSYMITQVEIQLIDPIEIFQNSKPIKKISLNFVTPTAFKILNQKTIVKSPEPKFVFKNLMTQWHNIYKNTDFDCPKELFDWINENIEIERQNTKNKTWEMGKKYTKFTGFVGFVRYLIRSEDLEKQKWLDILIKFGTYLSVGKGRTNGFGHYVIIQTI